MRRPLLLILGIAAEARDTPTAFEPARKAAIQAMIDNNELTRQRLFARSRARSEPASERKRAQTLKRITSSQRIEEGEKLLLLRAAQAVEAGGDRLRLSRVARPTRTKAG